MAVVSTTEVPQDRDVSESADGAEKTRSFIVVTDDATDTNPYTGVPALGADYPGTTDTLIVKSRSASHPSGANARTWLVRVEYGPPEIDEGEDEEANPNVPTQNRETDPADDPITETGEFEDVLEAIDRDLDDKPIASSAGEPFDPPIEEEVSRFVLTLEKVESSNPRGKANQFHNRINNADFYGFGKHTLRVKISYQSFNWRKPSTGTTVLRYRVRYRFIHNPRKWHPREILDQGFRIKATIVNEETGLPEEKVIEYLDDTGQRPSNPVKLNGQGQPYPAGFDGKKLLNFRTKQEAAFSALGLGVG